MELYDIFLDNLPKIDLHGFDKEMARIATNDFLNESVILGNKKIVIIHGIGSGIVKKAVHDTLEKNKLVESYNIDSNNIGCTVVKLK